MPHGVGLTGHGPDGCPLSSGRYDFDPTFSGFKIHGGRLIGFLSIDCAENVMVKVWLN